MVNGSERVLSLRSQRLMQVSLRLRRQRKSLFAISFYKGYCRFALKGSCKFHSGFADSERAFSRYLRHCRFALKGSCKFRSAFADGERAFSRYPFTKGIAASLSPTLFAPAPKEPPGSFETARPCCFGSRYPFTKGIAASLSPTLFAPAPKEPPGSFETARPCCFGSRYPFTKGILQRRRGRWRGSARRCRGVWLLSSCPCSRGAVRAGVRLPQRLRH